MGALAVATPEAEWPRILVSDDQPDVRLALSLLLKGAGFRVETAGSPAAVLEALARDRYDLLLLDLNYARDTTSGREGIDLLERLRSLDQSLDVVVMTAWGTIDVAVEAMRHGARDFVLKPWDNAALLRSLRSLLEARGPREAAGPAGVGRDLVLARRIQSRFLPTSGPPLATLEYSGLCLQAGAVGGDGYDFLELGPRQLGLTLADASGKGVPAALLLATLQGTLRNEVAHGTADLVGVLARVNAQFYAATAPEHFASLFFALYDDSTRLLRYVNCGHNPPLLLRARGGAQRLDTGGPALGLVDAWDGRGASVTLAPGDVLLVYSDGVTEAEDAGGEEFGAGRLLEVLQANASRPPAEIATTIVSAVEAFGGRLHRDDLTLVIARGRA